MSQASFPSSASRPKLAPPPFVCECKPDGFGSVRIHVEGELDLAHVPEFSRALRGAQSKARVVSLDLQGLAFIDCAALSEILDADTFGRRAGGKLILVRGAGQVDRVMLLTGVLGRMEVVDLRPVERSGDPTHDNERGKSLLCQEHL